MRSASRATLSKLRASDRPVASESEEALHKLPNAHVRRGRSHQRLAGQLLRMSAGPSRRPGRAREPRYRTPITSGLPSGSRLTLPPADGPAELSSRMPAKCGAAIDVPDLVA
jgi:hypothetical protein